jgi:hypothetical protein
MPKMSVWTDNLGALPVNLPRTNNYAATVDPTVSNDTSQGYEVGSSWVNTTSGRAWTCLSNSTGAASWVIDGQSGSGGFGTQGTPGTLNATGTLTAALMLAGIVTTTSAAAVAATLDIATNLDTAVGASAPNNTAFDFSIINTGPNTLTVGTASGWTLVGTMTVLTVVSGRFRARKTAAGAWTLYRLS